MFGLGGFGFGGAGRGPIEGYEHKPMTVDDIRASGGLLVDIRTPPEWFQTGIVEGAKTITFQDPDTFLELITPDLTDDQDLILICRSGQRTQMAGMHLAGRVPGKVISVEGGMISVVRAGYQPVALR